MRQCSLRIASSAYSNNAIPIRSVQLVRQRQEIYLTARQRTISASRPISCMITLITSMQHSIRRAIELSLNDRSTIRYIIMGDDSLIDLVCANSLFESGGPLEEDNFRCKRALLWNCGPCSNLYCCTSHCESSFDLGSVSKLGELAYQRGTYGSTNDKLPLENRAAILSKIISEAARLGDEDVVVNWTRVGVRNRNRGDGIGDNIGEVVVGNNTEPNLCICEFWKFSCHAN